MIRTQVSLDKHDYDLARKEAAAEGISIAEFVRRAIRLSLAVQANAASSDAPWMRYAGFVATGDRDSSKNIDDVVYGSKG